MNDVDKLMLWTNTLMTAFIFGSVIGELAIKIMS